MLRSVLVLCLAVFLAAGCSGIELPALGAAALSAGAGGAVKAGTEYTLLGTASHTFSVPLDDLAPLVRATLARLELPIDEAEAVEHELRIVSHGIGRTVRLKLTPITPALTRVSILVKSGILARDRATASELIAQIERGVTRGKASAAR